MTAPRTPYVALLRAVNVGGTGKLPMAHLKAMGEAAGFQDVRTYIASGNVVFEADAGEAMVKAELERRLADYAGKSVGVMIRTGDELEAVLADNPFAGHPPNRTLVIFLDEAPPADALDHAKGVDGEAMALGRREIYVRYTEEGMGRSKLRIPAAKAGTARNINTVAKLFSMVRET